jgi:hypothetical protein
MDEWPTLVRGYGIDGLMEVKAEMCEEKALVGMVVNDRLVMMGEGGNDG